MKKRSMIFVLLMAFVLIVIGAGSVLAAEGEIRSTGPNGETAVNADTIEITEEQMAQIKEGGYKAAICLHYGGNDWSTSQQKGLKDTFDEMGIEIVAVTDANFSVEPSMSEELIDSKIKKAYLSAGFVT